MNIENRIVNSCSDVMKKLINVIRSMTHIKHIPATRKYVELYLLANNNENEILIKRFLKSKIEEVKNK